MKLALALAALAVFSACKRAPQDAPIVVPTMEVVAGVAMIDFEATEAKFSCRVPGEWGVFPGKYLEPSKGLSLSNGERVHISILKYPDISPHTDARQYAETFWRLALKGKQPEITQEKIGELTVLRLHYERMPYPKITRNSDRPNRFDLALIPVKGGFYAIEHGAPVDTYKKTLPVFEAVVRSFKPKI